MKKMVNGDQATNPKPKLSKGDLRSLGAVEKRFRDLWSRAQRDNLYGRLAVGELVRESAGKYGEAGIKKLSAAVGRSKSLLYDYARVAQTFDRGMLRSWIAKAEGKLEWSHLYLLAARRLTREECELFLARILKENLSARALKQALGDDVSADTEDEFDPEDSKEAAEEQAQVAEEPVGRGRGSRGPRRPGLLDGLRAFDRAAQSVIERFDDVGRTFEEIENLAEDGVTAKVIEQLETEITTLKALQESIPRLAARAVDLLTTLRTKEKEVEVAVNADEITVSISNGQPIEEHLTVGLSASGARLLEVDGALPNHANP